MMKPIKIKSESGSIEANVYLTEEASQILIIASATGVKQEFYSKFAQFILTEGITVITFDYYGIGKSLDKNIKELIINAEDWGKNDLESVIQFVQNEFPSASICLLGHSIGGQLIGLAKSSTKLDKIILVAAQSGYWKLWNGVEKLKMWFNWHIFIPLLTTLFGYLPSKRINGMENLPKNVAQQWRKWGMNPNYILSDETIKETYYDKINLPITAYHIEGDKFAPQKAVDWMTEKYQKADTKSIYLKKKDFKTDKIGHFGIFKDKFKSSIWKELLKEVQK